MAEKQPIAVKHEHGTTINDGGRVVYRRMEKVSKRAEFVLDLPDFCWYLGISRLSKFMGSLKTDELSSLKVFPTPSCANENIINASEFNENGIVGKIGLSEIQSEYYVEYDASVLRTDQVAGSILSFQVKVFVCREDKTQVLLTSEEALGAGNLEVGVRGRKMKITLEKILEAIKERCATLRIVLNVQADMYKQPKPQSIVGTCGVGDQCDPPFLKPLQKGEVADVQLICEDQTFPVHGLILKSVSHVFSTMLEAPMIEAATGKIEIKDLDADTVKRMVDYIYHGRVDVGSNAQVVDLLYAAEKYEFDLLKTACLERMVASMSVENVTSFLEISVRVNAGDAVIKQMVEYCMDRIQELRKRKDFQAFARANLNLFF